MAGRRGCHVAIAILQNDFGIFPNLQAFNAYSYVQNNPLSFTDPSGYFLSGLFKAIAGVFKAILNSQIGRALIQIAACAVAIPACIAAAGAMALAAGGSIVDAIKSMAFSFISIGTWSVVGSVLEQAVNLATLAGQAISTVTHAVVGGALSVAQGGSFLEGFASAGLGSVGGFAGSNLVGNGSDGFFVRTALAATAGGIAAEITGGKFANGAITAAFAHLFNQEGDHESRSDKEGYPTRWWIEAPITITDEIYKLLGENLLNAQPTGSALKNDEQHYAPRFFTQETALFGSLFFITGRDPNRYTYAALWQYNVPGGGGIVEYVLDPWWSNTMTHQRFIPGGKITGYPNQITNKP